MAAIAITAIIKWLVIEDLNPTLNDTYSNIKKHLSSFGFEVVQDAEGYYSFDVLQSVMFEIVSLIITGFLY
jgi:virulence-associated protein VapD